MDYNRIVSFNEFPFYSEKMLPYVSPYENNEECCTTKGAYKIYNRGIVFNKKGKVKIKYLKAKMALHLPLSYSEILRLEKAQINANGYANKKKNFNFLNIERYMPYIEKGLVERGLA